MGIFWLSVPLISERCLCFLDQPLGVYGNSLGLTLHAAVGEGEGGTWKGREDAKLKLIMLVAYMHCVDILLAIAKV